MKKKNYENYKNLNKIINIKMLIAFILGAILSITSSYVIAETLIKSVDVSYVDNSNLKATNVQAAIDGTCTKFSNDLATLQTTIINKIYPVGSIYISYSSTNPSSFLGGTWEAFGKGQTLVGIDSSQTEFSAVGKTGGEKAHTLTVDEMPSHTHIQDSHSHTIEVNQGYHDRNDVGGLWSNPWQRFIITGLGFNTGEAIQQSNVLTQYTNTPTTATNQNTGGSKAHNNLQPYITVYMWKRTK